MSDAELIISRTELIIGEAKLTASKAKASISEPDLIIGDEQNHLGAACLRSILADFFAAFPGCILRHLQSALGWPAQLILLETEGVMTRIDRGAGSGGGP